MASQTKKDLRDYNGNLVLSQGWGEDLDKIPWTLWTQEMREKNKNNLLRVAIGPPKQNPKEIKEQTKFMKSELGGFN